jgi:hypothetical protein
MAWVMIGDKANESPSPRPPALPLPGQCGFSSRMQARQSALYGVP